MALGGCKVGIFEDGANQLVVESEHLEKQFAVFNVVAFLVAVKLDCVRYQLLVRDVFEYEEIRLILVVIITLIIATVWIEEPIASMCSAHRRANSSI